MSRPQGRRRASSVTDALNQIPLNHQAQNGALTPVTAAIPSEVKPLPAGPPRPRKDVLPEIYHSRGFWGDLTTGRWMLVPSSAFKILVFFYLLHFVLEQGIQRGIISHNPIKYLLFLQGRLPNGKYSKVWSDLAFVFHHVILWSFVRQFVTIYLLKPLAISLGIKGGKILRFMEQGYAIFYFSMTSTAGLYVMKDLPTWWYQNKAYWIGYPHTDLTFVHKAYYLLQASYWLQQTIILAGKIEKPRKDFKELVVHHIVTLWLIGWSYNVYMTYIGTAVFFTMDFSDIFLALAKCVNYVDEYWSQYFFAFFVCVWTYFRHFLNLKILWSVWDDYKLLPKEHLFFRPSQDIWMAPWIQWQILIPIAILQLINLFWYFLIWRILIRAVMSSPLADERSDDEDEEPSTEAKVRALKGDKAE